MGVHNLWGAKILEKMGFSRVVLSRETKLEDIIEIKKNTNLEIDSCNIEVLGLYSKTDTNESSAVVKLSYMGKSFLFMADVSSNVEDLLINEYGSKLDCDVLKVAHHGSKTATTNKFIQEINAQNAIISALEKSTFRDAVAKRRIVVPAAGFYEWNTRKEKSTFYRKNHPVLFMAGLYNPYEEGNRFTILTTAANSSMEPVHDRMPLLLEEEEILPWDTIDIGVTKKFFLRERNQAYAGPQGCR